jgi:hypothetical protein
MLRIMVNVHAATTWTLGHIYQIHHTAPCLVMAMDHNTVAV